MSDATTKAAEAFRRMADAIERNAQSTFGGAVVMIPPAGTPTEILILDNRENAYQFYANIKAVCDVSLLEIQEEETRRKAFGGLR